MGECKLYEVFDEEKQEKIKGQFRNGEVKKMFGIRGNIFDYADHGYLVQGRYRIILVGNRELWKRQFCEEWELARKKVLAAGGK